MSAWCWIADRYRRVASRSISPPTARRAHLRLSYPGLAEEDLYAAWQGHGIIWHRRSRNVSGKTLKLVELRFQLDGLSCGPDRKKDYFYFTENPRIYGMMAIPVHLKRTPEMAKSSEYDILAGNRWADPGVVTDRVGASPYQPFPAVLDKTAEKVYAIDHDFFYLCAWECFFRGMAALRLGRADEFWQVYMPMMLRAYSKPNGMMSHDGHVIVDPAASEANLATIPDYALEDCGQRMPVFEPWHGHVAAREADCHRAVKRNLKRFLDDFMFQLDPSEAGALIHSGFQIGTLKRGQNIKYLPRAFTEQGVAMLSSVLRSPPFRSHQLP